MNRKDQRLLVLSNAIFVHKEHQNKTTALVRRRLSRVCSFKVVVEEGVPGVNPVNATLLTILNKGDGLCETTVNDQHSRCLEEDTVILVSVVVRVSVHFRLGEVLDITGPANTGQGSVLKEEARLALVVQQLAIDQLAHFTLVFFCVQIPIQYRHFSWFVGLRRVTLHKNSPTPGEWEWGNVLALLMRRYQNGTPSDSREQGAESCCNGSFGAALATVVSSAALGWFLPKTEYCEERALTW